MKIKKLVLLSIFALIIVSVILYLTFAFVIGDLNTMSWSIEARGGLSVLSLACSACIISAIWIFMDDIEF